MKPFFSVVIPLFNKEHFIVQTLRSVLAQTFGDFEVIVIDDCSTDGSFAAASSMHDPRIRIVRAEKNAGLSASRNTGIRLAAADFVAFLDADDIWKTGFLNEIHKLVGLFPEASLFATRYEEVYPEKTLLPEFNRSTGDGRKIIDDFFAYNLGQPIYCPSSLCVRKSTFERVGFYDESIRFGEDVDFNIRANMAVKLAYSTESLVEYRMFSENQITNSPLKGKPITDFDKYEPAAGENSSLKKFLDFHRYVMAKHFRKEGDRKRFRQMVSGISRDKRASGLNLKQRLLLRAPAWILQKIGAIKKMMLRKGFRPTTYH